MSKCEKQVVTKLNKKLEKYGLSREELELKLHSGSLYGNSVYKLVEDTSKALTDYIHGKSNFGSAEECAKPLIEYVRANYCSNRDVATGNYDCPYATTVMNTICCTGHECNHKGIYEKPVVDNSLDDEIDECLSCPYYNPEAPDCCTYAPDACYYDADPDTYPF